MERPVIVPEDVRELAHTRFVKLYDLAYQDGAHYFEASRRERGDLLALKDPDKFDQLLPDAVSCCLVLDSVGDEPRLVLFHEYRYPTGQFLLSIPSGLIDAADKEAKDPLVRAMTREIFEECGLTLRKGDRIWVANPFLFNTPGLTDESTALLCAVVRREGTDEFSQAGAEGSECFDGFELLTKAQVLETLARGRDAEGHYYPMVTWAAMMYFASDMWLSGQEG